MGLGSLGLSCGGYPEVTRERGLILDVHPDHLTHDGDGTPVSAYTDLSGKGNHGVSTENNGPTYRATGWGGLPCLEFSSRSQWMRSNGKSLIQAVSGSNPEFTLAMLLRPNGNPNLTHLWSFGDPSKTQHFLAAESPDQRLGVRVNTVTDGDYSRNSKDYNQYTRAPHFQIWIWVISETRLSIHVDGVELKLDDPLIRITEFQPTLFALGARVDRDPISISGGCSLRRLVAYNKALSPKALAEIGKGLAAFGRIPKCGVGVEDLRHHPESWSDSWSVQ